MRLRWQPQGHGRESESCPEMGGRGDCRGHRGSGCKSADDEFAPAFVPKQYAFQGKVEPTFAGKWVTADGSSTLVLQGDGRLTITSVTPSASGRAVSNIEGRWLADGKTLMFSYKQGAQSETVLKYAAERVGTTLSLTQDGSKRKTVYRIAKP